MQRVSSDRWRPGVSVLVAIGSFVVAAGCVEETAGPLDPDLHRSGRHDGSNRGWDLPLSSAGQLVRHFPGRPCVSRDTGPRWQHGHGKDFQKSPSPYRDFDFWVGEWNVTDVNGTQIGTNIVTSELDGCLVQEHWTAGNGSRGLSLNSYDRETDQWYQTWSSQTPQGVFGRLRTSGNLIDGTMTLTGTRAATGGFTFHDTWAWSENEEGQVIQDALAAVPELDFNAPFTGIYTRGDDVTPAPPFMTTVCDEDQVGAAQREGDFLVGSWKVRADRGPFVGTSEITSELSDCLLIERFESRGGLEAISYTYVDLWTETWYRSYVDTEGERMELEGGFENGALVLRGTEPTESGSVDVTIRWQATGAGFRQTWEVSRDEGNTWQETATLEYFSK